jgi:hypothetical protein
MKPVKFTGLRPVGPSQPESYAELHSGEHQVTSIWPEGNVFSILSDLTWNYKIIWMLCSEKSLFLKEIIFFSFNKKGAFEIAPSKLQSV